MKYIQEGEGDNSCGEFTNEKLSLSSDDNENMKLTVAINIFKFDYA